MAKAKPYPEERTNDAWEDEASTTVEQGEVADKVQRALGKQNNGHNTNHTHTGTGVDEPTMDDQHAPVLSAITPIRAENDARLIITAGNDAGQDIEIRPGKSYTIGRGLDNDVVLTDIAVSRKHFDLKYEDGAWIIVDRGSGNGTVVNGSVEDNPFMLASGDSIEIGNTVFRFDQPNGAPRPSMRTFDDDEEMSTVAGKPVRTEPENPPSAPPQRLQRPKTLPPPVPLRAAHTSAPPPLSPYQTAQPLPPLPASTLPMPQMANRPPMGQGPPSPPMDPGPMGLGAPTTPRSPTMLGDAMGMPMSPQHMQHMQHVQHMYNGGIPVGPNGMPATLQGQGRPSPSFSYPQAQEIPPHSVHAQMLQIQTQSRRSDGSTAHVVPSHYDPLVGIAPRRYATPSSKRTKLALAGLALALLTGIVTAAVVKSSSSTRTPAAKKESAKKDPKAAKLSKPTAEPITMPSKDTPKAGEPALVKDAPKVDTKAAEAKAAEAKAAEAKAAEAKENAVKAAAAVKAADAKRATEAKAEAKQNAEARAEAKRAAAARAAAARAEKRNKRETTAEPKRVAVATDTSAARGKADSLYRARKFNDASRVLSAAASSASEDEADDMRNKAKKYALLGKAYAKGTAPAATTMEAFSELQSALNYDAVVGGAFKTEIAEKLATIAPKAAIAFAAKKEWGKAHTAYIAAKRAGSNDSNLAVVKQKLESTANELYAAASAEASSNPGPAKEKLKQIKQLVDATSPIAVKAQALYNKL